MGTTARKRLALLTLGVLSLSIASATLFTFSLLVQNFLVGTTLKVSPFDLRRSRSRQCAPASGLSASGPPLIAKGVQSAAGGRRTLTAVGMMFAPAVRRVRATYADGSTQTFHLSALTPAEARQAGLARFRYAAFATRGEWCVEQLVGESASGRVLWDSGVDAYTCGTASPTRFVP